MARRPHQVAPAPDEAYPLAIARVVAALGVAQDQMIERLCGLKRPCGDSVADFATPALEKAEFRQLSCF